MSPGLALFVIDVNRPALLCPPWPPWIGLQPTVFKQQNPGPVNFALAKPSAEQLGSWRCPQETAPHIFRIVFEKFWIQGR